jgi:hypothetical protein
MPVRPTHFLHRSSRQTGSAIANDWQGENRGARGRVALSLCLVAPGLSLLWAFGLRLSFSLRLVSEKSR